MKKVKIFISSTYEDMTQERSFAFEVVQKNNDIPGGMELFTGDNLEKFDVIKKDIEDSDIFILIMGGRYGTICKETNKSFIHMEYEYALSLNIPIGVIVINDSFLENKKSRAFSRHKKYYNEGTEKYNWFLSIVSKKMVTYYVDYQDLSVKILTTISKMKNDYKVDGWIKCNKKSIQSYMSGLSILDIIELTGCTVVQNVYTTEKDHYRISNKILLDNPDDPFSVKPFKNIFLMQRSSSLVLGAEYGWGAERDYLISLLEAIQKCEKFYHIITLEGIESHFNRKTSIFPEFSQFTKNLININGFVAVKKNNAPQGGALIKKLPPDEAEPLFKLDRQVRVMMVESFDNSVDAVFVWNIGTEQSCIWLKGPKMNEYLKKLISYFNERNNVLWREIEELHTKYQKLNK